MLIIHAHMQVKPDQEQAFLEASKVLVQASREEAGNISYDLKKSTEEGQQYTMIEIWENLGAIETHNTSEHFTVFVKQAQAFMAAPMDIQAFSAERAKL